MDLKMQAHLAKLFTDQKKTSSSVYESPRAMAKLLKEAKRVKQVLSANTDHMAQVSIFDCCIPLFPTYPTYPTGNAKNSI